MIKMANLQKLYEELKLTDIITYIQSGNVVFKADGKHTDTELAALIAGKIEKKYRFEVPVIIRRLGEVEKVLAINPFIKEKGIDMEKLHVTFLAETPAKDKVEAIEKTDFSPDRFIIKDKEVFLYCPNGYGNTKLSNTFFENKLKVQATTRNWKTTNKLAELAKNK